MGLETTPTTKDAVTDDFDPARDLPQHLQQYLTTTDKPDEIYQVHGQLRDRQLRLLTLRFFNQIQYGCENVLCDAPTCLSYRKRVASGPIRPHNEVTARALAATCVEYYASRGTNTSKTDPVEKRKSSVHGLCQNPPVIPWYTELQQHPVKRHDAADGELSASSLSSDKFDPASLSQYLFKHDARLRSLTQPSFVEVPTIDRAYILQLLPPSAVEWLQETVAREGFSISKRKKVFIEQSIFYVYSDPYRLLASVSSWYKIIPGLETLDHDYVPIKLPEIRKIRVACVPFFKSLDRGTMSRPAVNHLTEMLRNAYHPPPWVEGTSSLDGRWYLNNAQVAYLLLLTSSIICMVVSDDYHTGEIFDTEEAESWAEQDFMFKAAAGDETVLHLLATIADVVSHRLVMDAKWERHIRFAGKRKPGDHKGLMEELKALLRRSQVMPHAIRYSCNLLENMRCLIRARWNRKLIIQRRSTIGGALELWQMLYEYLILSDRKHDCGLLDTLVLSDVTNALNKVEDPAKWLLFEPDDERTHVLQYPFLLGTDTAWHCFRSINFQQMKKSFDYATMMYTLGKTQLISNPLAPWKVNNAAEVLAKVRPHMARYFVLTVGRESMLEDAIGQIWHREHQELTRPLKVRMGVEEGEEGLDHGGVQQEFFRLVLRQAFDEKHGLFDFDSKTRYSWFKPGALEPVYKYEALGTLMSLAVYNGVTVPVNLPLVFYRKVLGIKTMNYMRQIDDAWPDLARGFDQLLAWKEQDVGDAIGRTYEFSYEAFGRVVSIDMSKTSESWNTRVTPYNEADQAPLVTNANRVSFVKAYIYYLTEKSIEHQLNAFVKGLYTLVPQKVFTLFSPLQLKILVEGRPDTEIINVEDWERITAYEDYSRGDEVVVWFWDVLKESFTQPQLRNLLEFVTASDRLPISGWDGVKFVIQRHTQKEFLPGSSTCYGRLFLPEYESKQVLKEKLEMAIENSLGFGTV